jgi:hypothetical protein
MAAGDLLTVSGTVVDDDCVPIPYALLDIWQDIVSTSAVSQCTTLV